MNNQVNTQFEGIEIETINPHTFILVTHQSDELFPDIRMSQQLNRQDYDEAYKQFMADYEEF